MHGGEQRRQPCAARHPLSPQLDGCRQAIRLEDIGAHLEYRTVLPGRHGQHEWERDVDVHARADDVFTDSEIPAPQYLLAVRMDTHHIGSSVDQQYPIE